MDTKGLGIVVLLFVPGVFFGVVGFVPVYEHNAAGHESEPTTATVRSTDVAVKMDDGEEKYNPVVTYEYAVDGETYENDNTFPGRSTLWRESESWARDVVGRYEPGDEVTVHYDPEDPGSAYLRNDGLPGSWFFGIGYAIAAFVAGIWLIRKGTERWRQRRLIRETPTEAVEALTTGPSAITGTAVTADRGPTSAPFSDEDCVVARYEI